MGPKVNVRCLTQAGPSKRDLAEALTIAIVGRKIDTVVIADQRFHLIPQPAKRTYEIQRADALA